MVKLIQKSQTSGAGNQPIPGYLERDILDLRSFWKRPAPVPHQSPLITRIWHGLTRPEDADRYLSFLHEKGIRDYLATPGILEVKIGRMIESKVAHFWTISVWKDMDSIRAFAGVPETRARYYPEDEAFLLSFEPEVLHYETFTIFP